MAKGKNYRQAILAAVEEMNAWGKEVHLDALAMDTGIEPHKITGSISLMRHEGYPIDVVRREGRKILSWKFAKMPPAVKRTDRVELSKSRTELFKEGYSVEEVDALRGTDASEVMRAVKGYTSEDLEYGRRVLQNFDRLPQEVKDKIEVLKEVAPEFTEDLENVLVKVLGASSVQDTDPSFWAVDQFADGALMLARKDGTHWKATKL